MGSTKFTSKTYGDWKAVAQKLNAMPEKVDDAMKLALSQTVLKGEKIAVMHMKNQDLRWRKLNKAYKALKVRQGKSDKILVASSTYIQSITSFTAGGYGFVGVRRGIYQKGADLELANIALIMEYGSEARGIKPRKLWKPTLMELRAWIESSGIFIKEIKKKI